MTIISISLMLLSSLVLAVVFKLKRHKTFIGINLAYSLLLIGLLFYLSKIGGLSVERMEALFLFDEIISFFRYFYIKTYTVSYLITLGKISLCFFLIMLAINTNLFSKQQFAKRWWLYLVVSLPLVVMSIVFHPSNFLRISQFNHPLQNALTITEFAVITIYCLGALGLFFHEQFDIKPPWYRRRQTFITLSIVGICAGFLFLSTFNPLSILNDGNRVSITVNLFRLYAGNTMAFWHVFSVVGMISTIIICSQVIFLVRIEFDREKLEFSIKDKVKNANYASTVFVHGIKNQIISSVFLSEEALQSLEEKGEDFDKVKGDILKIKEINERMLERMDSLYLSLKNVNIVLHPTKVQDLVEKIKEKMKKEDDSNISYSYSDGMIFADIDLLSEAIYNIIINALDAVKEVKDKRVTFDLSFRKTLAIIMIADNGKGIDKKIAPKLFTPFTTNKNTNNNWGMGLCYARNIIKKHMGDIGFDSKDGKGTNFYITLPKFLSLKEGIKNGDYKND